MLKSIYVHGWVGGGAVRVNQCTFWSCYWFASCCGEITTGWLPLRELCAAGRLIPVRHDEVNRTNWYDSQLWYCVPKKWAKFRVRAQISPQKRTLFGVCVWTATILLRARKIEYQFDLKRNLFIFKLFRRRSPAASSSLHQTKRCHLAKNVHCPTRASRLGAVLRTAVSRPSENNKQIGFLASARQITSRKHNKSSLQRTVNQQNTYSINVKVEQREQRAPRPAKLIITQQINQKTASDSFQSTACGRK